MICKAQSLVLNALLQVLREDLDRVKQLCMHTWAIRKGFHWPFIVTVQIYEHEEQLPSPVAASHKDSRVVFNVVMQTAAIHRVWCNVTSYILYQTFLCL